MPIVSEVEFAKRINIAKRLLPWHRDYLNELLKYFMLMTPDQRREIIISKGYGDPNIFALFEPRTEITFYNNVRR